MPGPGEQCQDYEDMPKIPTVPLTHSRADKYRTMKHVSQSIVFSRARLLLITKSKTMVNAVVFNDVESHLPLPNGQWLHRASSTDPVSALPVEGHGGQPAPAHRQWGLGPAGGGVQGHRE